MTQSVAANQKHIRPRLALVAGAASLLTVSVLLVIKFLAYRESGAASLLASLIDSTVDASVSVMTFLAIRYSLKPADDDHRHGHGKVEGLAALLQAAFIAAAGFFLVLESITRFDRPPVISGHMAAITAMGISTALSVVLVIVQRYSLRYAPSLAVEADQAHYATDIAVNIGTAGVMYALFLGAPLWVDPAFAIIVALYLAVTVKTVAGKGIDMLLDRELAGAAREIITKKVLSHRGVLGMHDLRTSRSGMYVFISFDIEVNQHLSLHDAHNISRDVEHELLKEFPHAEIMIHVDPFGDVQDSRHRVAGVHH